MFALSPPQYSEVNQDKIFMVQLPKPEKAFQALEMIKNGIQKKRMVRNFMQSPGFEPGSLTWQARIITKLYYDCLPIILPKSIKA